MALRITVLICVTSGLAYWHLHDELFARTLRELQAYIEQRGIRDSQNFQLAEQNLETMAEELRRAWSDPPVDGLAEFHRHWEPRSDGTWRQRAGRDLQHEPSLFHGRQVVLTDELKRRLGLLTHLVTGWGRHYRRQFADTYVSTPQNSLINLWPGVDWGGTAAADLDNLKEEYVYVADPAHNPTRTTAWTGVYYDKVAKVWMVSVEKPVDIDGEWVATIGHDITLDELMQRAANDHLVGTKNILVRDDGRVIAHPDYMARIIASGGTLTVDEVGPQMRARFDDALGRRQSGSSVAPSLDGEVLLAVHRLAGPDWLFLVEYPDHLINSDALRSARIVFGLGLLSLVGELVVLAAVLRRQVAAPLRQLAASTDRVAAGDLGVVIDVERDDEIGQLAGSFNAMTRAVAERDTRLAAHAAALESAVRGSTAELRERNSAMRVILDHVHEGLVSIDLAGRIISDSSLAFTRWFGDEGDTLVARLRTGAPEAAEMLEIGLDQLASGALPTEVALAQLPTRIRVGARTLSFGYQLLELANGGGGVLVIVTDITADLAHEEADAEQRMLVRVVQSVVRDREGFYEFLAEVDDMVAHFVAGTQSMLEDVRLLHTLKGNSAIFGMSVFAEICHRLERDVLTCGEVAPRHRADLADAYCHCRTMISAVVDEGQRDLVAVPRQELEAVAASLMPIDERAARAVRAFTLDSVDARLTRLADAARSTAARLGKAELQIDQTPCGLRLEGDRWASFWTVCVHLVRNAVDHGIESPERRQAQGKPAAGRIELRAERQRDDLVVTIGDDGAGVDWQAVQKAAQARGLPCAEQPELITALFADGLSTCRVASTVSGRGVGLAAVRAEVESRGGQIDVHSIRGRGTRFMLRVPVSESAAVTAG